VLRELNGRADIEIDDLELVGEIGVRERAARAATGVQRGGRERSPEFLDASPELIDADVGREVDPDRFDRSGV